MNKIKRYDVISFCGSCDYKGYHSNQELQIQNDLSKENPDIEYYVTADDNSHKVVFKAGILHGIYCPIKDMNTEGFLKWTK
jgi:hypothetical protein